jgi:hypothetical protein
MSEWKEYKLKDMAEKNKHTAKKVSHGHYTYRGFSVICVGYYHPEHRVCWEAIDENGCGFAHGFSLKQVKCLIDNELDVLNNK